MPLTRSLLLSLLGQLHAAMPLWADIRGRVLAAWRIHGGKIAVLQTPSTSTVILQRLEAELRAVLSGPTRCGTIKRLGRLLAGKEVGMELFVVGRVVI